MLNAWVRTGEVRRKNIPEYDLTAVREALINAVAHRQYLMRGTNIEVGIYDDRIEIISCGGLEGRKSLETFLKKPTSSRRNQLLCDIFSRLDYMERRGSGIEKIFKAYNNDIKKPKIELFDDVFCVTFYSRLYKEKSENIRKTSEKHPKNIRKTSENENDDTGKNLEIVENSEVSDFENSEKNIRKTSEKHPKNIRKTSENVSIEDNAIDQIAEFIKNEKATTKKEIMSNLNVTEGQVKHSIKKLKERGELQTIGEGKSTVYLIKE